MGINSNIEWTHHTFNPWEGCTKVSPACDNCYAAERDRRYHQGSNWGKDASRLHHVDSYWRGPCKWNREAESARERRRVFCGSLCDVMEDRRDLEPLRIRLYSLIEETPWLDWLLLTKRPQNFRRFLPATWLARPKVNVWVMTTVESPEFYWRIETLRNVPAVVRGLSVEPLLAPIGADVAGHLDGVHWVIVGGESGPGARPMQPEWVRQVRDTCVQSGTAFFFKQWGGVHKKVTGRELDGRTWDEVPTVVLACD